MLDILVPVYNVERFLPRCIESVLAQTFSNFTLILVDDGSTDASGNICDDYAQIDDRVIVMHKENGGPTSARIAGINNARENFVAFLDSDDYVEKDFFQQLLTPMIENESIDISTGGYVIEYGTGKIKQPFLCGEQAIYTAIQGLDIMFSAKQFNWSLCGKIYRRSLFFDFDFSQCPSNYGEDTFVNYRIFHRANNVMYIPVYGYHYCLRDVSLMRSKFSEKKLGVIDVWADIIDESLDNGHKYTIDVMDLILKYGSDYIYAMQKNWDDFYDEIKKYKDIILKRLSKVNYQLRLDDEWRLNQILIERENYFYERKKLIDSVKEFSSYYQYTYIYGAGRIADEIAEIMEEHNLNYRGFVVTNDVKDNQRLRGKEIKPFSSIIASSDNYGFILAMNIRYENEVQLLLRIYGKCNFICVGRYSMYYLG